VTKGAHFTKLLWNMAESRKSGFCCFLIRWKREWQKREQPGRGSGKDKSPSLREKSR